MKAVTTRSIGAAPVDRNAPSEASLVEKPPVATLVIAWLIASNAVMPHAQRRKKQRIVNAAYMSVSDREYWVAFAMNFSDVSHASLLKICIPPTFSAGKTANAMMMMPTPPNH